MGVFADFMDARMNSSTNASDCAARKSAWRVLSFGRSKRVRAPPPAHDHRHRHQHRPRPPGLRDPRCEPLQDALDTGAPALARHARDARRTGARAGLSADRAAPRLLPAHTRRRAGRFSTGSASAWTPRRAPPSSARIRTTRSSSTLASRTVRRCAARIAWCSRCASDWPRWVWRFRRDGLPLRQRRRSGGGVELGANTARQQARDGAHALGVAAPNAGWPAGAAASACGVQPASGARARRRWHRPAPACQWPPALRGEAACTSAPVECR